MKTIHQNKRKIPIASLFLGAFFFFSGVKCLYLPTKTNNALMATAQTAEKNPYGWEKILAYTTYFNEKDVGRCANIAIAAALINGVTVQAYGEFSFNATVGKRTEEAGFKQAKIIVNGEYVQGVGGGVCQVRTTLYNAALKSGLEITEYHPHSLRVSYVAPSRDAMVSTQSDLKFQNPHPYAVYLSAKVAASGVCVTFYGEAGGKSSGERYELISQILEETPPPAPIVKTGDKDEILRAEKQGAKSALYLECYKHNRLISRKRLRTDEYRPIQGIIVKKVALPTRKIPSNDCVFYGKLL